MRSRNSESSQLQRLLLDATISVDLGIWHLQQNGEVLEPNGGPDNACLLQKN
jgi:hypothetical protein